MNKNISNLLKSYENTILYNTYGYYSYNGTLYLAELEQNNGRTYLVLETKQQPIDEAKVEVSESQVFRGCWKPVNEDLNPTPLTDEQVRQYPIVRIYSGAISLQSWYASWAQLEFIKLQLESLLLTENLTYKFQEHIRKKRKIPDKRNQRQKRNKE
jgi:hypothetical protein